MVWLDRLGVASLVSSHPLPVQPRTQAVHSRNVFWRPGYELLPVENIWWFDDGNDATIPSDHPNILATPFCQLALPCVS